MSGNPALEAAATDAVRSVQRGRGAARQSEPLDVVAVPDLGLPDDPLVPTGPYAPADAVISGAYFMLREIELSAAMYSHVNISADGRSASWLLPTSKQDCRAVGITRTWDCICDLPVLGRSCPVHALARQLTRVRVLSQQLHRALSTMPGGRIGGG